MGSSLEIEENKVQITIEKLMAIIGAKEVELTITREQVQSLTERVAELEAKQEEKK